MTTVVGSTNEVNAVIAPPNPKYFINIEGIERKWPKDTITTEEIATLGGWAAEGVIEIDSENVERTLAPNEVIHLRPGVGFAKKIRWQRGDGVFDTRLIEEFHHLKHHFLHAEKHQNWFVIRNYPMPKGWNIGKADIAFRVLSGYPATPPYGFFVPAGLRYDGAMPGNYQEGIADVPPFDGQWGMFSWSPQEWKASDDVVTGFNLLNFALSFTVRLKEGA